MNNLRHVKHIVKYTTMLINIHNFRVLQNGVHTGPQSHSGNPVCNLHEKRLSVVHLKQNTGLHQK